MNTQMVNETTRTLFYQGFLLHPYRPTAFTPQPKAPCGLVVPPDVIGQGVSSQVHTQCLVKAPATTTVGVQVRFLHMTTRVQEGAEWAEAVERVVTLDVGLGEGCLQAVRESFRWPACRTPDHRQEALRGDVEALVEPLGVEGDFFRLTVIIANTTTPCCPGLDRQSLLRHSLVSTHVVLQTPKGRFVSLLDPAAGPEADAAESCCQDGLWPVLVGDPGTADAMLASPLMLADYPQPGAEAVTDPSPVTDLDEMLILRTLTLTDEEKQQMRRGDPRARRLLAEAERLDAGNLRPHPLVSRPLGLVAMECRS